MNQEKKLGQCACNAAASEKLAYGYNQVPHKTYSSSQQQEQMVWLKRSTGKLHADDNSSVRHARANVIAYAMPIFISYA